MNEIALTESPTLRAQYVDRVDVLDKVKELTFLADGEHMSTEMVADYYEVGVDAIESVVRRNRQELEDNGYHVLRGKELREFETVNLTVSTRRRAYALFVRRTILNVGEMLTESWVAEAIRKHLLDVEERARQIYLASLAAQQVQSQVLQPKTFPFVDVVVLMRQEYGVRISVKDLLETLRQGGVMCQDERKPKVKYEGMFWHTGSAYEVHAHHVKGLYHLYESTKLRLQAATQRALPMDPPGWPELPLEGGA